jgi:hypothetical protein
MDVPGIGGDEVVGMTKQSGDDIDRTCGEGRRMMEIKKIKIKRKMREKEFTYVSSLLGLFSRSLSLSLCSQPKKKGTKPL